ncbi:MAG TPA: ATP-dependent Clp protease ATP-binding subunit [Candidatus Bipolaricaulota bacterium]|nr:ATP-dependent Clp protease ATP-binding subunit [Candidatus Bipolaricaulota bacterium]
MTEKKPLKKLPFLVCDACKGAGVIEDKTCRVCQGLGAVLFFKNKVFYWGKRIDTWSIYYEKFTKSIKAAINIILILLGLSGFFILFWQLYKLDFAPAYSFDYWFRQPSFEKFYFWLTVVGDLYLYYRIDQETDPKFKVLKKEYRDEDSLFSSLPTDWQDVLARPKSDLIDVAKSYNDQTSMLIDKAFFAAQSVSEPQIGELRLFYVLPESQPGMIIFSRLGLYKEVIQEKINNILSQRSAVGGMPRLSLTAKKILIMAYWQAMMDDKVKVEVTDLAAAFTIKELFVDLEKDYIGELLLDLDLNRQKLFNVVVWIKIQNQLIGQISRYRSRARLKSKSGIDRAMTATATPFLNQISRDLTQAARVGALFPCVDREKEFEEIFRIIEGSRSSALLVGFSGVGKTSILEGLAQKMIADDVPDMLKDKRLVSLSVPYLVSGATPAQAEERLLQAMAEASRARNIVIAIENIHDMIGITAGQEAGLDLGEVLADILTSKQFFSVATTTPADFANIEASSLAGSFQNIKVEEPEINEAIQVLEAKSGPIEYANKVFFSYDSLDKAVVLSSRYLHDKYLPQKALEIIEQVGIAVRKERGENQIVTGDDVAKFISEKTSIPVSKITQKEASKLLNLEEEIHHRIIGQEEAVKMVASSLRRARAELREGDRPIASLLFLGPTGVGKTELAKTVGDIYFGSEENMIRLDMSEYQTPESIYRLIGAPAGASKEGGYLTDAVRKNPFTVLLVDEIEKAHPDVLNLFLQVMEDGRLTDNTGRTIDFTNLIIIMTSNAGSSYIQDAVSQNKNIEEIKNQLLNVELREYFRPEFLNRYDGIMVFKPLTEENVYAIAKLLIAKVAKRLEEKGITFQATDEAIRDLAHQGFDPKFGARPLRRVIQTQVDDALANYLLTAQIGRRDTVTFDVGGKIHVEKAEAL